MEIKRILLEEIQEEHRNTRKILEAVPVSQGNWKPTPKSMSLIHLAAHVADLFSYLEIILNTKTFDLAESRTPIDSIRDKQVILSELDLSLKRGIDLLERTSDEILNEEWTFKYGGQIISKMSRAKSIRHTVFNHMIHHRGQLTMFLRLLDIKVPGIFGPTADEMPAND